MSVSHAQRFSRGLPPRWSPGRLKIPLLFTVVPLVALFMVTGCRSSEIRVDPPPVAALGEADPTVVITPPRPTPTPIPLKAPVVRCIGGTMVELPNGDAECRLPTLMPTPTPSPTLDQKVDESQGEADNDVSEPDQQTTATPEPTPTPAPRFRAVSPPALADLPGGSGGSPIFQFSGGPSIQNNILTLSGYIKDRPDLASAIWTVQVWQSDYPVDLATKCSTEKPVAFLMAPTGSGASFIPAATPYEYFYCVQGQGMLRTVDVPWIRASQWSLTERGGRRFVYDPFYWDFSLTADLNDERVYDLEYRRPEGWTILIWAGETLITREWLPW